MSIRYCQFCPVSKASEMLGERWTILIIRELLTGSTRFSDFQRGLSRISPTLLARRLTQLQDTGLIVRSTKAKRPHAEYHLTPAGKELLPIVLGLARWGMRWARGRMSKDELDVEMLMQDFSRRLDHSRLPSTEVVIKFTFTGLRHLAHWWIVLGADRQTELCTNHPGRDSNVEIRADVRTMVEIWAGDIEIGAARRSKRLQVSGELALISTMPYWLRGSLVADIRPARAVRK